MSQVCLCHHSQTINREVTPHDDAPIIDPLKIYQSPLALCTDDKQNIVSKHRKLNYERKKICYEFTEIADIPNSRDFTVSNEIDFKVNDLTFQLADFHFHNKGENIIDGKQGVSELHFVFGEKGIVNPANNAVLAFIFRKAHKSDKIIKRIKEGKKFRIPEIKSYFTYSGSLTKVNPLDIPQLAVCWHISTKPLKISEKDLEYFNCHFNRNHGDIQDRNGRNINFVKNH